MNTIVFGLYDLIVESLWSFFQIGLIILLLLLVKNKKINSQKIAIVGFILLALTMLFNLFQQDYIAGKIAEYVWILFAFSFTLQLTSYLRYQNKHEF